MKAKRYLATWRSAAAEQRYRDLDAELWQRDLTAPAPEVLDVPTSFGTTRAYRWPGDGPPIVFLHGMGDTSVRWIPFAERLEGNEVYAIDIMGDVGASSPTIGFTSAADYPDWLHQAITGLGITNPVVVGYSLGGYVALSYAMLMSGTGSESESDLAPAPVSATVTFDPVGVVKLRLMRLMAQGVGGLLASISPSVVKRFLARRLRQPLLEDKLGLRLYTQGQRQHPIKMPPLPVFTDEELASIRGPLTVLVGQRSTVFDIDRLVERINGLGPGCQARLVPDAGHALAVTHFDDCLAAVRSALVDVH